MKQWAILVSILLFLLFLFVSRVESTEKREKRGKRGKREKRDEAANRKEIEKTGEKGKKTKIVPLQQKVKGNEKYVQLQRKVAGNEKNVPFKQKVEEIYRRVAPCLQPSATLTPQRLAFDQDLEAHYRDVLAVTGQYRGMVPHNGSGNYRGMNVP